MPFAVFSLVDASVDEEVVVHHATIDKPKHSSFVGDEDALQAFRSVAIVVTQTN